MATPAMAHLERLRVGAYASAADRQQASFNSLQRSSFLGLPKPRLPVDRVKIPRSYSNRDRSLRCEATLANEVLVEEAIPIPAEGDAADLGFDRAAWEAGYKSKLEEESYEIVDIVGEVPRDLEGTFFRNGPGKFEIGSERIAHPFDGDGMIASFAIKDGKVHFQNKYVRTEGYVAETKAGRILFRNSFGTQRKGGPLANALDLSQKNLANTNVIVWGGKCLALWEAMQPHAINPKTLDTVGIDLLNGTLKQGVGFSTGNDWLDSVLPGVGGEPFTAHPHIDPVRKRLVGFGSKFVPGKNLAESSNDTVATFYEYDEDFKLVTKLVYQVDGFMFAHDFCFTQNNYIIFQAAVSYDPVPFLMGFKGPAECLKFKPKQQCKIHIVPRPSGKFAGQPARVVDGGEIFAFHHANAYETEDGKSLVIDSVCLDKLNDFAPDEGKDWIDIDFSTLPNNTLWRHTVDLQTTKVSMKEFSKRQVEFPTVNWANFSLPYRYVYSGASRHPTRNQPLASWMKLDTETGQASILSLDRFTFFGEPLFVPRPNSQAEDDGWLLGTCYDGNSKTGILVIADAQSLEKGPVAVCRLQSHLPYGLHTFFSPKYFGPA